MKILLIFGTRPEAIKMLPLYRELKENPHLEVSLCITGQHQDMVQSVLDIFDIEPDFNLHIMKPRQDLTDITIRILSGLKDLFQTYLPDLVLVHGDTATTFSASLACFYHKIRIGHIEAGLRTHDLYSPWPEEGNRRLTTILSSLNFAPTQTAKQNLIDEGHNSNDIFVTGNTVIDALFYIIDKIESNTHIYNELRRRFNFLDFDKKIILITGHRRENFGNGFESICAAISKLAKLYSDIQFVYPMHMNPNVREPVIKYLSDIKNVFLIEPLDYLPFVFLMNASYIILTDSGGIQEEAPSLGKPVLVMRETTERPEAVMAGTVRLVGTNKDLIYESVKELLEDTAVYLNMSKLSNPYGDGRASAKIARIINERLYEP